MHGAQVVGLVQARLRKRRPPRRRNAGSTKPRIVACQSGAQGRGFDPRRGRYRLAPTALKLKRFHVPILVACWGLLIIVILAACKIGNCSRPFISE